jgi:DHA3 family macrolide efflux protein-like MFS transporter
MRRISAGGKRVEMQPSQKTFRSYLFFWSGQLASLLGSSVVQFVIIWWITLETGSALYLSVAAVLGLAPMIVLSPFAGVLIDRWSRKILIGFVDFVQALATVVLIVLFSLGSVSIWYVFAMLTLRGICQAFHSPAVMAVIPSMVPKEKLSRMNGLRYLFIGAISLIGPVVAALLLDIWKISQILWIDVVTFVVALTPLLLVKIPSVRTKLDKSSFRQDFADGFRYIKSKRGLLPLMVLAMMLNFLLTPLGTLLPYYVKFDHLGEVTDLAFVEAALQGGILAGGVLMSIIKEFKRKMVVTMISLYMIFGGYALAALTPTSLFLFMATALLAAAIFIPIVNVLFATIIQTAVPLKMQGRVNSVDMGLSSAAQPLGMILSGLIIEFTRASTLFLSCAAIGALTLTASWFLTDIRHVEKLEDSLTESKQAKSYDVSSLEKTDTPPVVRQLGTVAFTPFNEDGSECEKTEEPICSRRIDEDSSIQSDRPFRSNHNTVLPKYAARVRSMK